ncbi:MAG: putative toxin-antitoxin system toxin component, PIN family [Rhodopila sp.]
MHTNCPSPQFKSWSIYGSGLGFQAQSSQTGSNIYVSGLQFGGLPLAFLNHARAGAFRLTVSEPLLAEIHDVLRLKFAWSDIELATAMLQFPEFTTRTCPKEDLDVIPDDPDDNCILECAVAAQSEFIVSGDKHLLRLCSFRGIRILKVAAFMGLFTAL